MSTVLKATAHCANFLDAAAKVVLFLLVESDFSVHGAFHVVKAETEKIVIDEKLKIKRVELFWDKRSVVSI